MKIKSVKITGFRAFEKEEDSTFDFTKDGEIMNFASIYAPNGFGKTSFYDAVEWGVTHKIQRFDRMVDFEKVRKDNDAPLLLNKASTEGKVIVETNNELFENIINIRKKYDYKAKASNEYFKDQILTQDLIDAFLKEEKADKRYENFLDIDDNLKKYDSIYKKINRLLEYIKDEKKGLVNKKGEEEKKLQGEIDFEQEFKKFDEINQIISSLNNENENFNLIDQSTFNQTSYDNLSRNVEIRLFSLEEELIKAKQRIDTIILARDGEESEDKKLNRGILSHLDSRSKILKLDEQQNEFNQIVKWFEAQEKINNESNVNDENLQIQQNRLEHALNIEKQFETFLGIQKEIDSLHKNIAEFKDKLLNTERDKFDFEQKKNDIIIRFNELKNSLENNRSKLNNLPGQQKQMELINQSIVDSQKNIDDLSKSIGTEEKKQNDLKTILDEFGYYEDKIRNDIALLLEFKLFDQHKELITNYISEEKKLENFKRNIQEIQFKIDNQNQFNKELNDFINLGLELVNNSKSSDCPLCNYSYDSFEKLSENILSNKLLDSKLKIYLEEKIEIESNANKLVLQLSVNKEKIEKAFTLIKQPYLSNYKNRQNVLDKLDSERKANLEKLNSNQAILNNINLSLGDSKTFEELSTKTQKDLSKIDSQILELSNQMKKNDETLLEKETLIKSTQEKLEISERNLLKYQSSNEYKEIREYFIKELNVNNIEKSILSEGISNIQIKINDLTSKKESAIKSLHELKIKLSNYTLSKNEYIKSIEEVNDIKNIMLRIYESYENYIQSEFGIIISDKDKFQIENAFIDLIERQKEIERQAESKIEKFKIVKILNDACIKATESKKVQDQIKMITNNLKELGNSEEVLNIEKEHLRSYLKDTIEAYFYTPLINAIYRKIDPHPDYTLIKFECDFAENKPRLQIYTGTEEEDWSVPSLYFSTAQVNILSLSIFLARALKTKDDDKKPVDCIFIDDPIQSMDSINILSFIDLFRGITLFLDKQLIVSTHEENFHLLLKKKIPSELFKSKFLEFETFGKLKAEDNELLKT
ncbi:AAA family ATPase [Flavobacterium taihuense]|uniref:AAA family ATPase n=1 Tax=Flavobacterium taihuense TaxID=2857508 RepID=A0ABS6XSN4_9FLAO|nr:AAA family ATPase [Flavobacterium taihuense]MBW4359362.1 AAA family ATPase [Flavobacterium taihuense]